MPVLRDSEAVCEPRGTSRERPSLGTLPQDRIATHRLDPGLLSLCRRLGLDLLNEVLDPFLVVLHGEILPAGETLQGEICNWEDNSLVTAVEAGAGRASRRAARSPA